MSQSRSETLKYIHTILAVTAVLPATLLALLSMLGFFVILGDIRRLDTETVALLFSMMLGLPGYVGLLFVTFRIQHKYPVWTLCLLICGLLSIGILFAFVGILNSALRFVDLEIIVLFLWPFLVGVYFTIMQLINMGNYSLKEHIVIDQD